MTLLLLLLVLVVVVALVGGFGGPSWYGRRPTRRVVEETVYEEPGSRPVEVVEDVVVEDRRRVVDH